MKNNHLPFTKKNYQLMLTGIAIIVLGFVIMGLDQQPHGFGFMGLTLGPIVVLFGFLFQFYAIFYKKNN
ncbi:DUF3098 domain-containing protein [Cyclobacterium jeungdonense]|uniref:DUF3098 domain-containing protein n=1 Tax=Cyclobacterium jeungdonense TaxID=708087 RepID=A0ABT8C227_9BACT|nr:DUF3098 domain-containing protein [Cyclobacterium jeungdonense]MDN3686391.1 DUF3098 domain-containing protein [Cyclobacterium jeungdonense]